MTPQKIKGDRNDPATLFHISRSGAWLQAVPEDGLPGLQRGREVQHALVP